MCYPTLAGPSAANLVAAADDALGRVRTASRRRYYAAAARRRRRLLAYGVWNPSVDPGAARAHVQQLRAAGLSVDAVAELAGVSTSVVAALLYPDHGQARRWIRPETEAALLGVTLDVHQLAQVSGKRRVSATGTARRLEALARLGWSLSTLATQLGVSVQAVGAWRRREKVTAATAQRVADLYERLSMTPGPSAKAARAAQRAGYQPPLAWDDEDLDTAQGFDAYSLSAPADVELDEVLVERVAAGHPALACGAQRPQMAAELTRRGLSAAQIGRRLGVSTRTVERWRAAANASTTHERAS